MRFDPCDRTLRSDTRRLRNAACDLIFMGSHGRRSNLRMMLGSQTLKVLMQTEIPVLVARDAILVTPARAPSVSSAMSTARWRRCCMHGRT